MKSTIIERTAITPEQFASEFYQAVEEAVVALPVRSTILVGLKDTDLPFLLFPVTKTVTVKARGCIPNEERTLSLAEAVEWVISGVVERMGDQREIYGHQKFAVRIVREE